MAFSFSGRGQVIDRRHLTNEATPDFKIENIPIFSFKILNDVMSGTTFIYLLQLMAIISLLCIHIKSKNNLTN